MPIDAQMIQAIGNLGAVPLLGILLWQAIKIRRNGDFSKLEEKIDKQTEQIEKQGEQFTELSISVARIAGHLNID